MDEDAIQNAMIIRMAAELLKGLANVTEPGEGDAVGAAANPDAVSLPHLLGDEASAAITGGEPKPAVLNEASPEVAKETIAAIAPLVDAQQIATPEATPLPKSEAAEPEEASELPPPPSPTGQPASKPVFEPMPQPAVSPAPVAALEPPQPAVSPAPVAALEPPQPAVSPAPVAALEPPQPAVSPAPVAVLEPPQPAVSPAPVAALEPPQPAVSPAPVAVLANAPSPNTAAEALEPNFELQAAASPEPVPLDVFETQRNTAEQPQAINYDQGASTPESALLSDIEYPQPAVQQSSDPTLDINQQLQQAAEQPRAAAQQIEDLQQVHRRFLDTHTEVIESLRSTPQQRWTPEQRQQARQIRQAKEEYQNRILDLTKGPVQGAEPPPPPRLPAFGSERPIETENLFAAQRPAAQPPTWVIPEGVPTGQPTEQARLQAAVEAATPAEFVTGPPPPESPAQPALAAIPDEYRGNLASDALSEAVQIEAAQSVVAPPVFEPEAPPVATPPGTIWERMARRARQAIDVVSPPISEKERRRRESRQREEAIETMRRDDPAAWAAFAPDEEEEPLSSVTDDDDFWSALPPTAVGGGRGGGRRRGGGGRRQGGGTSDPTPPDNILHVWVDGGKLQEVKRIGAFGQGSGGGSQGGGQGSGNQATGSNATQGSTWSDWLAMQSMPALTRYLGQQTVGTAASAASPFIGSDNAAFAGGLGESMGGAVATAAIGLGTGNPAYIAQGMALLGKELITLPKQLHDWSEALIDSQLAAGKNWVPEIAAIDAVKSIREILRTQESGKATYESLQGATMQWQQFKDYWRPTKDWWTNALNEFSENVATDLRRPLEHEQKIIDEARRSGRYRKWQEETDRIFSPGAIWDRTFGREEAKFLDDERKKHPEKFAVEMRSTHAIFDNWMRDWQQGKFNMKSNRPVPK